MSDGCYCDWGDPVTLYRKAKHKARKAHKCTECHNAIPVGETYERVSMLYEGSWSTDLTCCRCLALREWVQAHVPCFCWLHGTMLTDAHEAMEEYSREVPGMFMEYGRLRVAANRGAKRG